MIKKIILLSLITCFNSCISKKLYTDLQGKYDALQSEKKEILSRKDELLEELKNDKNEYKILQKKYEDLKKTNKDLEEKIIVLKKSYDNIKDSHNLLISKSSSALAENATENRNLLAQLATKETELLKEMARLKKLKAELAESSKQIESLKQMIAEKEQAMTNLKTAISNALQSFQGKGLTVIQKNGKVYVSMENKLLFKPGSWSVGLQGRIAVEEVAKILVKNPKIKVLIEGHTDTDPYKRNAIIEDNWDLSVKRATAIVRILVDSKVNPRQITAAGRSSHLPIASNKTQQGKAKNRRIEIILSPNLDKVHKLLSHE